MYKMVRNLVVRNENERKLLMSLCSFGFAQAALDLISQGHMLADVVAIIGKGSLFC